jgi:PIN domain nuclease of toxin-antitoxin system
MRLLLDTHAFLWFVMGDNRLSQSARAAIEDPANEKRLSVASLWEIAIKHSLGKLRLAEPFEVLIPREMHRNALVILPIEVSHLARVDALPFHHRDPFDRLLIAQALVEDLNLVSIEAAFDTYRVSRIW